jgi:hypothetical protein
VNNVIKRNISSQTVGEVKKKDEERKGLKATPPPTRERNKEVRAAPVT